MMKKICVFGGSAAGHDPALKDQAERIGAMAAARNVGIVFGGGHIGMMGAVSASAHKAGGYVHGVIPEFLKNLEVASSDLSKLTITEDMHERKTLMYADSDAFLALPGGFGTMEEIMEIITWRQLRLHNKPIMLFNYNGFWDSLVTMFHQASEQGFIRAQHLNLVDTLENLDEVADFIDTLSSEAETGD